MQVRFLIVPMVLMSTLSFESAAQSSDGQVAVTRFEQETHDVYAGCRGWRFSNQHQLRTQLETALHKNGVKVLERKSIRQIHEDEFELPNQDPSSQPERKKFLSARYSITGGITELGTCEEESKSGVQLGGVVGLLGGPAADLEVGGGKTISKVTLVAKLVSTKTGEVLQTFEARGQTEENEGAVSGSVVGIGANHARRSTPPIEAASKKATDDLAAQIAKYLKSSS